MAKYKLFNDEQARRIGKTVRAYEAGWQTVARDNSRLLPIPYQGIGVFQGKLAAALVAGASPDTYAQVNVLQSDGSNAPGGPFGALNLFCESGASGATCILVPNGQTSTNGNFPWIILRVVPQLLTTYQPGYDGNGNWTSIAQSFYGSGSSPAGDATAYAAAAAAGSDQTRDATTTALSLGSSSITYGATLSVTATVSHSAGTGDPSGEVVFLAVGGFTSLVLGTAAVGSGGVATLSLSGATAIAAGAWTLTAAYGGDGSYNSSSGTASLTVSKATPSITLTAAPPSGTTSPNTYGSSLTLTALFTVSGSPPVQGPTGFVIFKNGSSAVSVPARVGLVSGYYQATLTLNSLPAGNLNLTAAYQGDTNFNTASGTLTQTVNQAPLTVTADNASMGQGSPLPALTASYSGFLLGDSFGSAVTGLPSLTTTGSASSPPGSYPINCSAGTLSASNYTFSFNNGTLTIT